MRYIYCSVVDQNRRMYMLMKVDKGLLFSTKLSQNWTIFIVH